MIKHFCDRCGREIGTYEAENYMNGMKITIDNCGKTENIMFCTICEEKFNLFMKGIESPKFFPNGVNTL